MTTSVLDRVPVERISERARQARPGRALLALVGGLLVGLGFVTAKLFAVLFTGGVWCWAAVAEGWAQANGPTKRQQIDALSAQVEALSAQVQRFGG